MADATRELKVVINSDVSNAESGLKGFGGTLKSIGTIAAGLGLADLTSKVVNMGKSFIQAGVETATFYENAKIGFTTLLKDSEKANNLIAQIKKDALATPFDAASLVQGNRLLISAGVSAQAARKDILNLGNAIMATGGGNDELSRMAVNLQQIKNVGQATALDIKQFAFAGIPIYQLLAEATGKNVSEVKEMTITYDLLSQALDKAAKKGGMFAGATENAAGSMQQVSSNLKEAIGTFAADILTETGVFDMMKKSMLWVTNLLNDAKGPTIAFFKSMKDGITGIYDLVVKGDFTKNFGKTFHVDEDNVVMEKIFKIRNALIGLFDLFVKGDFTKRLGQALNIEEDSTISESMLNLRRSFLGLGESFVNLYNTIVPIAEQLKPLLMQVFNVLTLSIQSTIGVIVQMLPYILDAFTLLITTVTNTINFIAALPTTLMTAFNTIVTFFTSLPGMIMTYVNDLFTVQIPYAIGYMVGYVSTAVPTMVASIVNWFSVLPGAVLAIMVQFYNNVINKLSETWAWISTNVSSWPGKIQGFISSIPGIVAGIFENTKQEAVGKMNQMLDAINSIWQKIKSIFEGIISKANEAWNAVQRGFEAGAKAGARATGGFASGMTLVGENGPELVSLPTGSYVHNASDSRGMMGGQTVNININNPQVRSDNDIQLIISEIKRALGRENELVRLAAI